MCLAFNKCFLQISPTANSRHTLFTLRKRVRDTRNSLIGQYFEMGLSPILKKSNTNNKVMKIHVRIPGFEKGSLVKSFWKNGYLYEIKSLIL